MPSTIVAPTLLVANSPGSGLIYVEWTTPTYTLNGFTYSTLDFNLRYRRVENTTFTELPLPRPDQPGGIEIITGTGGAGTPHVKTTQDGFATGVYEVSIVAVGFGDKSDPSNEIGVSVTGSPIPPTEGPGTFLSTHITGMRSYVAFFPPYDFNYYDQEPGSKDPDSDEVYGLVDSAPRLGAMLQVAWLGEVFDPRRFGARDKPTSWGDGSLNGDQGTLSNSTGAAGAPTTLAHQTLINDWLKQFQTLYTTCQTGTAPAGLTNTERLTIETTFRNAVWALVDVMKAATATWAASATSTTMTPASYNSQLAIIFQAIQRAQDQYQYQIDKPNRTDDQVIGEVYRAGANLSNNFNIGITNLQKLDSAYNGIVLINQKDPSPVDWTHVYTNTGIYWMVFEATPGIARGARMVKVLQRKRTPGQLALYSEARVVIPIPGTAISDAMTTGPHTPPGPLTTGPDIYKHDLPYPVMLDPSTEGGVDSAFALHLFIPLNGTAREDAYLGQLKPRSGVVVFGEDAGTGQLVIIAGGFITNRTITLEPHRRLFDCIAYDPLYWMNDQYMREQQYDDKASLVYALQLAQQAGDPTASQDAQNAIDDAKALEFKLNGYIGGHFLTTCRPDYAAAHIIQHLRIKVSEPGYTSPEMWNLPVKSVYGNLAQFADIYVDPEFNEGAALGSFHSFAVNNGGVLSNVRQMLENTGATFHSRSNLTFKMTKKPFYAAELPPPTLHLALDGALSPVIVSEGEPPKLYKIIIEKPMLAQSLLPTGGTGSGDTSVCIAQPAPGTYIICGFTVNILTDPSNPLGGYEMQVVGSYDGDYTRHITGDYACLQAWAQPRGMAFFWEDPNDPVLISGQFSPTGLPIHAHTVAPFPQCAPFASAWRNPAAANATTLATGTSSGTPFNLSDAVQGSVNPADFQYEYICGEPGGQVIGPIANVFAVDLVDFAVGLARETTAHWQVVIPLGDYYNVDLGDIIHITVQNNPVLPLDWEAKPFWVNKIQMLVDGIQHTRQITAIEARPDGLIPPQDPNPLPTPPATTPPVAPPVNPGAPTSPTNTTGTDGCIYTAGSGLIRPSRFSDMKILAMEAAGHTSASPVSNVWVTFNWYGPCSQELTVRGNIPYGLENPSMEKLANDRKQWKGVFQANTHYELDLTGSITLGAAESDPLHVSFTTPNYTASTSLAPLSQIPLQV